MSESDAQATPASKVSARSRIPSIFESLRAEGRRALMPFICGGRPTLASTGAMLGALERAGASIVEIGVPFSDPIADGPVIAAAMHTALVEGVTPAGVFEAVAEARGSVNLGLVAMASVSLVQRGEGVRAFCARAAEAGFDGFIFPDAPLEEADELVEVAGEAGLTASLLVAPTTPPARAAAIAAKCSGFVYLLARAGITGERDDAPDVERAVAGIRSATDLPIAVGFGISSPEHVAAVVRHADAAIVGSALVRRIESAVSSGTDPVEEAERFVAELALGLSAAN